MNTATMVDQLQLALKDTNEADRKWSDNELTRFAEMAMDRYSQAAPQDTKETIATTSGSRTITPTGSQLANVVRIYAVEYPIDKFPRQFQRFQYYAAVLTLEDGDVPDGSNCYVYFGKKWVTTGTWAIPVHHERTIQTGAAAYAMYNWSAYVVPSGLAADILSPQQALAIARQLEAAFETELKRMAAQLRTSSLYSPALPPKSKTTDWGP